MILRNIKKIIVLFLVSLCFLCRCNLSCLYKTNKLTILNYPIETNVDIKIVRKYMDTLIAKNRYVVPAKWQYLNKLVENDSINNVRVYFKDNPEEMYLISYSGMILLSDVYNPKIVEYDWISKRELLPPKDFSRIKLRIKRLFEQIDSLANPGHTSKVWIRM